jgi:hypothetical protein
MYTISSQRASSRRPYKRLWGVEGPKREVYLLIQDVKSYGGKGVRLLDNFLDKVSKAAESERISEETVRESLGGNRTEAGTIPPPSRCQVVRWEGGVTVHV